MSSNDVFAERDEADYQVQLQEDAQRDHHDNVVLHELYVVLQAEEERQEQADREAGEAEWQRSLDEAFGAATFRTASPILSPFAHLRRPTGVR